LGRTQNTLGPCQHSAHNLTEHFSSPPAHFNYKQGIPASFRPSGTLTASQTTSTPVADLFSTYHDPQILALAFLTCKSLSHLFFTAFGPFVSQSQHWSPLPKASTWDLVMLLLPGPPLYPSHDSPESHKPNCYFHTDLAPLKGIVHAASPITPLNTICH
jgi:hypothetical protein